MQCGDPGWEDIRHRRYREQRGSSPRQHGDLRPLHQHLDTPAVTALSALQTRLRGHQKVHPEWLRVEQTRSHWIEAKYQLGSSCGTMCGSLGPGWSVSDLWTRRQHSFPLLPTPVQNVLTLNYSAMSGDDA